MRLVLFLTIFINFSFASYIKSIEILKDNPSLSFENIKKSKRFKPIKQPIIINDRNNYWLKIKINKNELNKEKHYILQVKSKFGINVLDFDNDSKKNLIDYDLLNFNKTQIKDVYIKVYNLEERLDLIIKIFERKEYFKQAKERTQLFGISYGIIFAAFLYYLAFFIFNRQRSYIYYSLTQLSLLLIVMLLLERANANSMDIMIYSLAVVSFFIFSNLFTQHFLNIKQNSPILHKILMAIIIIMIIESFSQIITQYFPPSLFMVFYIIAAIIVYIKTKSKPILIIIDQPTI